MVQATGRCGCSFTTGETVYEDLPDGHCRSHGNATVLVVPWNSPDGGIRGRHLPVDARRSRDRWCHNIYAPRADAGGGTYAVSIASVAGCSADATNTIDVRGCWVHRLLLRWRRTRQLQRSAPVATWSSLPMSLWYSYEWSLDGDVIPVLPGTLTANTSGNYLIASRNLSGCNASATNTVGVLVLDAPPAIAITANASTTFCAGGSVELVADEIIDATYAWSLDNVVINGATTNTLAASASGNYTVIVTNLGGCNASATNTIDVLVLDAPPAIYDACERFHRSALAAVLSSLRMKSLMPAMCGASTTL